MNEYSIEELKEFLKHEEQKMEECTDILTKGLMEVRCRMYKRLIEFKETTDDNVKDNDNADEIIH